MRKCRRGDRGRKPAEGNEMTAGGVGSEVTGLLVMWHEGKERNESSQELLWVLIVHLIQTPHFPFHSLYHCCDYLLCSNVLHLHVMIRILSIIMEILLVLQTPKRSKKVELRVKILQVYPLRMFQHFFGLICLFVQCSDRTVKHQAAVAIRAGVEQNSALTAAVHV